MAVIVPKKDVGELKMDFAVPAVLYGPLASDQTVGQVVVRNGSEVVATFDAVCPSPVGQQQLPIRQQPGVGDVPSASFAEIPAERGATIRVVTPPGQVAAPVPAIAAPISAAAVPMNAAIPPPR